MKDKIKVIFLDIDGVLNSGRYFKAHTFKELNEQHDDYGQGFDELSKSLLNKLIDVTGAKVVISSSWRGAGFDAMKNMWVDRKMSGEVIGITPHFYESLKPKNYPDSHSVSVPRGCEIEWYYENIFNFVHWNWDGPYVQERKALCTLDTYIILDDDSDMLYSQRNNFVHCDNANGFTQEEYDKAYQILMNV